MRSRLLYGPGVVEPTLRQAAFLGDPMPASLAVLVEKIRFRAYQVTDLDVAEALAAGWTESELFELTVAAAAGVGFHRLDLVDRLLEGRPGELL